MVSRSTSNGMDLGILNIVPLDFVIVFVVWIVFSVVAVQGGRGEILSIVTGSFIALSVYSFAGQAFWLKDALKPVLEQPRSSAILFLVLVVLGYLAIRQLMLPYGSDLMGSPMQSAIIGLLSIITLLALWVALPFTGALWTFGPLFQTVFAAQYAFWWIVGSLIAMVVFA